MGLAPEVVKVEIQLPLVLDLTRLLKRLFNRRCRWRYAWLYFIQTLWSHQPATTGIALVSFLIHRWFFFLLSSPRLNRKMEVCSWILFSAEGTSAWWKNAQWKVALIHHWRVSASTQATKSNFTKPSDNSSLGQLSLQTLHSSFASKSHWFEQEWRTVDAVLVNGLVDLLFQRWIQCHWRSSQN